MQALMLAAGKGFRLGKYTKNNTKCMLEVNGKDDFDQKEYIRIAIKLKEENNYLLECLKEYYKTKS